MRGSELRSDSPFSHVDLEARVPAKHPLRAIHSTIGRPSIPPEQLLRAVLLQAFHTVRSERRLMEQPDYNLLFRWFTGLGIDDPVWDVTVFTKNRDRLLDGDIAGKFMASETSAPGLAGGERQPRWRDALERHPRFDHGRRRPALSQGQRPSGPALFHGACAHGEPQRPGCRRRTNPFIGAAESAAALAMASDLPARSKTVGGDKALYGVYLAYGLPHGIWSYAFIDQGQGHSPFAHRYYTRRHFIGPYGGFTVPAQGGRCGWVKFFKADRRTG